jgi:hypothetical protein
MKKYFLKISALFLLFAIFFTASSFCFHGLFGQMFDVAEAKTVAVTYTDDACGTHEAEAREAKTSHQNSLLPCCVSDSKPDIVSADLQINNLVKFTPVVVAVTYESVKTILISTVYYKPLFSPPELLALRSTILRI